MGAVGSAILDFGTGINETSVTFADAAILAGSKVEAFFMGSDTSVDHTANDHKYAPVFIGLTASANAGVGGIIYARSEQKMTGQWAVNWVWI
jgi:hypothetical protein